MQKGQILNNPIPEDEWVVYEPLVGETMLELGNKKNPNGVYKKYFESIGFNHVSVDWNGEDGALKLDLRKPIDLGQFDMVTNIGTTEHVSHQEGVWCNIHNACKLGGVIVSVTPYPEFWWWHGEHYPTEAFFESFADLNGYKIEYMDKGRQPPNVNLCVRLKKIEVKAFRMPDESLIYKNKVRPR